MSERIEVRRLRRPELEELIGRAADEGWDPGLRDAGAFRRTDAVALADARGMGEAFRCVRRYAGEPPPTARDGVFGGYYARAGLTAAVPFFRMRSNGMNTLIGIGAAVALALLVGAVWAAGVSTAAALASTGLLILLASVSLAIATARPGAVERNQAATAQRDRMRQLVP